MTGAGEAAHRQVLEEWGSFLRELLPTMVDYAERRARNLGLGPGHGEDLIGETAATLFAKRGDLAVIMEHEDRRKFVYGVLNKVVLSRVRARAARSATPRCRSRTSCRPTTAGWPTPPTSTCRTRPRRPTGRR